MFEQIDAYIHESDNLERLVEIRDLLKLRLWDIHHKMHLIIQQEAGV